MYVWEANEKGNDEVHMQTNPSQAELMYKQYQEKKKELKSQKAHDVFSKYGGNEHMNTIPKELLYSQSENYVEYSETVRNSYNYFLSQF